MQTRHSQIACHINPSINNKNNQVSSHWMSEVAASSVLVEQVWSTRIDVIWSFLRWKKELHSIEEKVKSRDYSFDHITLILLLHYLVKCRSRSLAVYNNEFILGSANRLRKSLIRSESIVPRSRTHHQRVVRYESHGYLCCSVGGCDNPPRLNGGCRLDCISAADQFMWSGGRPGHCGSKVLAGLYGSFGQSCC